MTTTNSRRVPLQPPFDVAQGGPEVLEGPDPTGPPKQLVTRSLSGGARAFQASGTARLKASPSFDQVRSASKGGHYVRQGIGLAFAVGLTLTPLLAQEGQWLMYSGS